eukprot:TRINITY_DN12916_c0_g1_i1.p1 TRINITY_DN12916_c0_g1~~TRINITY_DN12916_c0_g1_i1.p1  ORF type:complete len:148 (+),score=32.01 TRINITY_DN12916_c0_g1_i1:2-445(+)
MKRTGNHALCEDQSKTGNQITKEGHNKTEDITINKHNDEYNSLKEEYLQISKTIKELEEKKSTIYEKIQTLGVKEWIKQFLSTHPLDIPNLDKLLFSHLCTIPFTTTYEETFKYYHPAWTIMEVLYMWDHQEISLTRSLNYTIEENS